jgi:peptidoglycan glycosyltransferase
VRLTVEQELQAAAVSALQGQRGAALVIEANSGEIWALASAPTFDPAEVILA